MKSGRKKAQTKKEKLKTKTNHYIPEDYSDEVVSEIKSQLQLFNRKQLEKLICELSQEVLRLEHMLQSCSLCIVNDNGQSEHSGCQTIINGDSESKHLRTKCSVVHRLVQSVKSVSQFTTNKAGEIMEQQWRVNNEQLTKTEGCKTDLNLNNEIVGDEHENSCEHTDMQLPSHQKNVECSSYTRIHQPPMKRRIVSDDACLENMFFSKATKFNRKKEMNNNTQILTNDKVLNSTCEENKNPLRNQKNEPVSLELEHQAPSTDNSQANSKLIPSTDNSQANSKLIPPTDNSQASSKLIPSTGNSQASSKLIPSTDNSQANSKLIPSTGNSQASSKLIPSTGNSQASSKLIPSADNSQASSKLIPSTDNSQANSNLIPSTGNSQASSKLIPSTDNSQASSKLIPSTGNSQASSKLIPSTGNSQASSKLIPSTGNSQANSKLIPSTDNSQASSKLIPSTGNSQASSKLIPSTDNSQANSKPIPSTGNSQASSKLIPSTGNSQASSKLIPSADNSQASSKLIPSTDNSQANSNLIPSTGNSQASSKLIPSTDNSQASSKLIPSTGNSQASSKLIPSTGNSQASSKLIPSTGNSQANSKLIPSTDNSQASFKLSNSGQHVNNEKGSAQDRADVTHYGSVPREKIQLLEKSNRYKVTKWPSVRSVLKIASEASSVKDVLKIPSETSQENGLYICFFCQVPFQSKLILIEHMKTEHDCRQYCCIVCGRSFRYKHSLKAHQRGSHSGATVLCSYCGKLVLQARLDLHMEKVHERPSYTCHICQKGFLKRECMDGHINKHSNTKPYICEHCGRKYAYSTSLSSHRKQCARASMPPHLQHPRSLDNKSASCVCEICGLKFEGVSGLKDHLSAKHSDKVQYCSFCGKGFQWRPSYNRHIKKCVDRTDLERDRYRCLKSQKTVNRHYVCVCGKQYPYRQSFRRHERSCHQKQVESSISNSVNTASSGEVPFSENLSSSLQLSTSLNLQ